MPLARQHKWVAKWLRNIYQLVLSEQIGEPALTLVYQNYASVQSWLGSTLPSLDKIQDRQWWLEFLADEFHLHQQKTGLGIQEHDLLPKVITGDKESKLPWQAQFSYQIALDNFRSAFNVGSIFRVCDAVGFEGVITGAKTPGSAHHQVQKTAMGCTNWIPGKATQDLAQSLQRMKVEEYSIIGVETVETAIPYTEFPWPEKAVIVLGNEEYGLSQEVLRTCNDFVRLPMYGRKNSVNVANAFTAVAYHVCSHLTPLEGK